jgi:hypothetical protein
MIESIIEIKNERSKIVHRLLNSFYFRSQATTTIHQVSELENNDDVTKTTVDKPSSKKPCPPISVHSHDH